MKKTYFTLVGTDYRFGSGFLKPGMKLYLRKEPDNSYDSEAIRVTLPGLGTIGYVGNSINTVIGDSSSAGRLGCKIGKKAKARVKYITKKGILCVLTK